MIRIQIGNDVREIGTIDEGWINQEINQRRNDELTVCVKVTVKVDDIDLALTTPSCNIGGGPGRAPRIREEAILHLWNERGLNDRNFNGGNVIAFLKQLKNMLR